VGTEVMMNIDSDMVNKPREEKKKMIKEIYDMNEHIKQARILDMF